MNKRVLLIGFTLLVGLLLLIEVRTHSYEPEKNIKNFGASIIQKTEEAKDKLPEDITNESLLEIGFKAYEEGMTDMFLNEIAINPLLAKKQIIKINDSEEIILNIIDQKNNYPLILTQGYTQQENLYKVSELSKESFLLMSKSEKDKNRFVTTGKNTIIGLLYSPESKKDAIKILSAHNLKTP